MGHLGWRAMRVCSFPLSVTSDRDTLTTTAQALLDECREECQVLWERISLMESMMPSAAVGHAVPNWQMPAAAIAASQTKTRRKVRSDGLDAAAPSS